MSELVSERPGPDTPVLARLGTLDRSLPVRIVAALALGLFLGRALPGLDDALDMSALSWILLPDLPEHRTGLVLVGLVCAARWARRRFTFPAPAAGGAS